MSIFNSFKNTIEKIKNKDSFVHGLSWTFSATSLSFLLQLVFAPVLSRIYGPEAYGEFAIFNVIVTNLSAFATMGYPQALLTKSKKSDFNSLSLFILLSTILILIATSIIFYSFHSFWLNLFHGINNFNLFPLVIITVFLYSINTIFSKWNIKKKRFSRNAKNIITSLLFSKSYAIVFGLKISNTGIGIISSEVFKTIWLSFFLLTFKQIKSIFIQLSSLNESRIIESLKVAKNAINYPLYIWPGTWLSMFSNQLPIFFFTGFFSLEEVGAFTFAGSLITIPSRLIGNAIRPVFFQKSQELYDSGNEKTLVQFTRRISLYLFLMGLPVFLLIIFFGPQIFVFIFGDNWVLSGKIASYMAFFQIAAFSAVPVESVFLVLKQEKQLLYFNSLLFVIRLLALTIGVIFGFSFLNVIFLYTGVNFIIYSIFHLFIRNVLKTKNIQENRKEL